MQRGRYDRRVKSGRAVVHDPSEASARALSARYHTLHRPGDGAAVYDDSAVRETAKRSGEPSYVRRAEEYLAANLHRHVSVSELASVTGIRMRTLSAAFRLHRGASPKEFLEARRLEFAELQLSSGASISVTEVALACGFEHLGRFSARYRARFGVSPSTTMRRHRVR
jgi:AraC-like DNA-binding protein